MWTGISSESRIELVFIENGSLISVRYVEEIFNEHVGLFMVNLGEDAIFMYDNSRLHTGFIVNDYLQEMNITRMEWSARSADINPIKHAWDEQERCVKQRNSPTITFRELKIALTEELENICQNRIRNLVYMLYIKFLIRLQFLTV